MNIRQRIGVLAGIGLIVALVAPDAASASTYRWQLNAPGNWTDPANWEVVEGPAGLGYPSAAGDIARFDAADSFQEVVLSVPVTIGVLDIGPTQTVMIAGPGGQLTFDNAGEDARIDHASGGDSSIRVPLTLDANLVVTSASATGSLFLDGGITEANAGRALTKGGPGTLRFIIGNSYSGVTTVLDGRLALAPVAFATMIPGDLVVGDAVGGEGTAKVDNLVGLIANTSNVLVRRDGITSFSRSIGFPTSATLQDLTIEGGTVGCGGFALTVQVSTLTIDGGSILSGGVPAGGCFLDVLGAIAAAPATSAPATIVQGELVFNTPAQSLTVQDGSQAVDLQISSTIVSRDPGDGVTKQGPGTAVFTGDNTYTGDTTIAAGTLRITGNSPSSNIVVSGGRLEGTGTVGAIAATTGAVAPGTNAGIGTLTSGAAALAAGVGFDVEIGGATYDSLAVTGTVDITNAALSVTSISPSLIPPSLAAVIIDNDGSDPVIGTFAGLAQGATITTASGAQFVISYAGGTGNDVVLTNVTPLTYYLSEGATGSFFDEDILIANPNATAAPVQITFFQTGGGAIVHPIVVPPQSRATVHVDEIPGLEAAAASALVLSIDRLPLAVERTMFWDSTHYGGHTANAVGRPEPVWHFAEGAQNDFFQTYLLLANPQMTATPVTITFLRETEAPFTVTLSLPAQSRTTLDAGAYAELVGRSFGMTIDADQPITTERAMYFASTPSRLWTGGHDNVGAPELSTSWFHPEGASGTFFSTFILMSNPQTTDAAITLRFLLPDGEAVDIPKTIPAQQRLTVNPAAEGIPQLENAAFATVVTSSVPIVSERAMYWPEGSTTFGEGHASSGLTTTARQWSLAEGRSGGTDGYATYVLLANPNATAAEVTVTFLRETGAPIVRTYTVPPTSRFNVDVGGTIAELQNQSFGATITVTNDVPIAVERSMYWNANGLFWSGGTNAIGTIVP